MKKIIPPQYVKKIKSVRERKEVERIKEFYKNGGLNKLDSFKSVLVLMLVVIFYYVFIAADRYVSEVSISVKATDGSSSIVSGIESLVGVTSNSREDIMLLKEYIKSPDMLKKLDEKIHLRQLYEAQKLDVFFKLSKSSSQESYLSYYRDRIHIVFDDATGLLNVSVEGFTPNDAFLISSAILEESERFINEVSRSIAREQLQFAENELEKARKKYEKAKNTLLQFQNQYGIVDPQSQIKTKAGFITEIDLKISQKETELNTILSYLNDTAPQVVALKAEINALKTQLDKEKNKVASNIPNDKLNSVAAQFESLFLDFGFAEDVYKTALTAVETTRIEIGRKAKQLIVVQSPNAPESALYPRKLYNIITIFVMLSLIFGIVRLVRAIIDEHRY